MVIGARTDEQLAAYLGAADLTLTNEEQARLELVRAPRPVHLGATPVGMGSRTAAATAVRPELGPSLGAVLGFPWSPADGGLEPGTRVALPSAAPGSRTC